MRLREPSLLCDARRASEGFVSTMEGGTRLEEHKHGVIMERMDMGNDWTIMAFPFNMLNSSKTDDLGRRVARYAALQHLDMQSTPYHLEQTK